MREFYGDGFRWFDLVRTQIWAECAGKYTIANYMYLRPIPQGQIDGMEMDAAAKKDYQNLF